LAITSPLTVTCRRTLCTSTIGDSPVTRTVFLDRAHAQVGIDGGNEGARELDALAPDAVEARERERHAVSARPEIDDAELTGAVGHRGSNFFDELRARRLDGYAREHGTELSLTTR
jgi:hypothetical protein